MKTKASKLRFSIIMLTLVMMFTSLFAMPASASGPNEVLPLNQVYEIGGFTFTDTNLTPVKIPAGRYLKLGINFKKASIDAGLGNVKLTIKVKDANTGAVIANSTYTLNAYEGSSRWLTTNKIDLGYANRKIQVWFDASSTGQSNGNYRSIQVLEFKSTVYN